MSTTYRNGLPSLIELASDLVSAYVSNNPVPMSELPHLISHVHAALSKIMGGAEVDAWVEAEEKATPSQIRNSVMPDALISFIDGKPYKTLKRHLAAHGLDPRSYRQRYGLPTDYPMVASGYAEQRSQIARAIGLGVPGARGDQRRTGTRR